MKYLLLFISYFMLVYSVSAADTLIIHINDLEFTTAIEREQFENANNKTIDYLKLALAIDTNTNESFQKEAANKVDELVAVIETKINRSKPLEKNVKIIYNEVHNALLKKYELVVPFHRIFKDGTYNCVTGTILFALVLNKLDIAYEIKETPNHVFLVAAPGKENIYIESTDPVKGYYSISDEGKRSIIKALVDGKLISKEERDSKSEQQLIDEYFNQDKKINLQQLISLQYSNQGIMHSDAEEIQKALESLKKSYFLYPTLKTHALLNISAFQVFYKSNTNDNDFSNNFRLFVQLNKNRATELKHDMFLKIANNYSEKNDDMLGLTAYYESLLKLDLDSTTKRNFRQIYYSSSLANHYYKKDAVASLQDLEQLLILEPKNVRYKAALDEVIKSVTGFGGMIDFLDDEGDEFQEDKAFAKLDSIAAVLERMSVYTDNPKAKSIRFLVLAYKVENALDESNSKKIEELVSNIEKDYAALKTSNKQVESVLYPIYRNVCGHYYKLRDYKSAKAWLLRGLKTFPENEVLQTEYNQIKNY